MDINSLEPKKLWSYFEEICKIPRVSGNTKPITKYLMDCFTKLGYTPIIDEDGNIYVKKEAYQGYADRPSILLQGHSDMVGAKTENSTHDFSKDPIQPIIKDNFIVANNTSLGADNGIGVAMILTIFADKTLKHGPIEALLTSNEEIGFAGIMKFDVSKIQSKYMINLDWELESTIVIGCAGSHTIEGRIPIVRRTPLFWLIRKWRTHNLKISISNGLGGHSGLDIGVKRINAIKQMFYMLDTINLKYKISLIEIEKSGVARNVIPQECTVHINVKKKDVDTIKKIIDDEYRGAKNEFENEKLFKIVCEESNINKQPLFRASSTRIISFFSIMPNGIQTFNEKYQIPETSSNLGQVWCEGIWLNCELMIRSPHEGALAHYVQRIHNLFEITRGRVVREENTPSWLSKTDEFVSVYEKLFNEMYEQKTKQVLISAGIEASYICYKKPEINAFCIGPNTYDVHTTKERLDITSTQKVFKVLLQFLEQWKK